MDKDAVILFTRNGMGESPHELQIGLAVKFLELTLLSGQFPGKIIFYTEGVRLCCTGSPAVELLKQCEEKGVELVLCATCLDFLGIREKIEVGIVGGMGDILTALQMAPRVISL
jgi:predicted peroxiredoxin